MKNFSKILFRKFTWRHRLTLLCSTVVKVVRREIGEIVLFTGQKNKQKFCLRLKLSLQRGPTPATAVAARVTSNRATVTVIVTV